MKKVLWLLVSASFGAGAAYGATSVRYLDTGRAFPEGLQTRIDRVVMQQLDAKHYREVRAQMIYDDAGKPDHVLVHLHSKTYHKVEFATIAVDSHLAPGVVTKNYQLQAADLRQQPAAEITARCPDETVEFISMCPNDDDFEIGIAKDVAKAAKAKGLKTVELYLEDATSQKYLNYMSCPNLRGNFYDGDADPTAITTYDGVVAHDDFSSSLKSRWKHKVTNIWLACQGYNDPLLGSVIDDAETRKYAAGRNDLLVGPSDNAAACAMKAALDHKPMEAAFNSCYEQFDDPEDQWGFGGNGTDNFWD